MYIDNIHKIGGINKCVQIDETLVSRRKYNKGRMLQGSNIWVFGGICVEDNQVFAVIVPDRSANTLLECIDKYIEEGTQIVSDCWKVYYGIDNQKYSHLTVNHSENFIDPYTGANTQKIERFWRELKQPFYVHRGIRRNQIQDHISESLWRYNEIKKGDDHFYKAIELCRNTRYSREEHNEYEEEYHEEPGQGPVRLRRIR